MAAVQRTPADINLTEETNTILSDADFTIALTSTEVPYLQRLLKRIQSDSSDMIGLFLVAASGGTVATLYLLGRAILNSDWLNVENIAVPTTTALVVAQFIRAYNKYEEKREQVLARIAEVQADEASVINPMLGENV